MKRSIILLLALVCSVTIFAQEKMYVHRKDHTTQGILISATDSVYFSEDNSKIYFRIGENLGLYSISDLDSISFGADSNTISVNWNGSSVSVVNPLVFEGVTVNVIGADVIVNSKAENRDINYQLSGSTTDGMFKIYSEDRFNLLMSGVSLSNADGPAINIQSGKKCTIVLNSGTVNSLADGSIYSTNAEDQKSAFFSEGQLEFTGTGNLTVKSNSRHAISSDDYISITEGTITVSNAAKDGIHANDLFKMSGGTLNVTATGDGIDCEGGNIDISGGTITTVNTAENVNGISSDSTMLISGGTILMTVSGNQSKGLRAKQTMTLSGGEIIINTSGAAVLQVSGTGYDPAYCAAIKGAENIIVDGSKITIKATGAAGKGISCSGNVSLLSGILSISTSGAGTTYKNSTGVTDAYGASCISTDGNLIIKKATVTVSSSGAAGKGISVDGTLTVGDENSAPAVNITTTGTKVTISTSGGGGGGPGGGGSSGSYAEAKAITCDGAITVNNGTINISSNDDGIKSPTSVTINNGTVNITNSVEGIESPLIVLNNGFVNIVASNDGINATYSTVKGGTEQNDGSYLKVNGGTLIVSASAGDAVDSNGNIQMTGGTVFANGPQSGVEEACDFNGTFSMNGGVFIGAGSNSNMSKAMSTSSTQVNLFLKSGSSISSSTLIHVQNSAGTDIATFKPKNGGYYFLVSSPKLTKGASCSIYTGGSYSGGTTDNGIYSGGTYSGGTLKKTATLSSSATVNTISF